MKRTLHALLCAFSLSAAAARQDAPLREEGPVQLVGTNGVMVLHEVPFMVTPQTKVSISGKRSSLMKIRQGAVASVTYQKQGGLNRAIKVDVSNRRRNEETVAGKWQSDSQWLAFEKQIKANSTEIEGIEKQLKIVQNVASAKTRARQNSSKEMAQVNALRLQISALQQQNRNWQAEQGKIQARYQTQGLQKEKQ